VEFGLRQLHRSNDWGPLGLTEPPWTAAYAPPRVGQFGGHPLSFPCFFFLPLNPLAETGPWRAGRAARSPRGPRRARSHCRSRNRGADHLSESGMKWTRGGTQRQCHRTAGRGRRGGRPHGGARPLAAAAGRAGRHRPRHRAHAAWLPLRKA
jgi:hypothetical protein